MDSYDILNVARDSSDKEIEIAYEDLKRKYDPSFNTSIHAYKKYREILKAYECIKDEQRRKMYDLKENEKTDNNKEKLIKLYDYSESQQTINNINIDYSRVDGYYNVSRQDKKIEVEVSYLYKLLNFRYDLEYVRSIVCKECNEFSVCPSCNGQKVVEFENHVVWCPTCKGSGKVSVSCRACGGTKTCEVKERVSFYVDDDFKEFKGLGDEYGENDKSNLRVNFIFYDKDNIEINDDVINVKCYLNKKEIFEGINREYFSEMGAFKIEVPAFADDGYQKEIYFNNKKIVFTFYGEKCDGENIIKYLFINRGFKDKYIYFNDDYSFCSEEEKIDCLKMTKCVPKIVVQGYGSRGMYGGENGDLIINVVFNNDNEIVYTDKVNVVESSKMFNLLGGRLNEGYHYGLKGENSLIKKGDIYYYLIGNSRSKSKLKNYFLFKVLSAFLWILVPILLIVVPYSKNAFIVCIISMIAYMILINLLMEVEV